MLQILGTSPWSTSVLAGNSVYGCFATVLGLLAGIALSVQITVPSLNSTSSPQRLWPRSVVQRR